jgi:ComF family protein
MNTDRVRDWAEATLEFIYPPICLGCGQPRESRAILCDRCSEVISYLEHPICIESNRPITTGAECEACQPGLPLFALGDHIGPIQQAVIGLKFHHVRRVAHWAGLELIARQKNRILELSPSALVPVPLHAGREYFRGFNQAELLAESLADDLDVDIRCDLVIRKKHRRVQSRLSGDKRFKNVRGVFEALPADETVGGILIVDDVVTSGATVSEVSRVLREAGHRVVGVVAIAHRG